MGSTENREEKLAILNTLDHLSPKELEALEEVIKARLLSPPYQSPQEEANFSPPLQQAYAK
jgi:hypothetical protein